MQLWTIQPKAVYDLILKTGVYRCDPFKSEMLKPLDEACEGILEPVFQRKYDWLVGRMEQRIGKRPDGVIYPVWAWYRYEGSDKPDLRKERWSNGNPGTLMACILLDIPDDRVVLSDFGNWHHVLNGWPIVDTEDEADKADAYMDTLTEPEKDNFLDNNWERVFETDVFDNGWTSRGQDVQATFWELRREDVRGVRFFTACEKKHN